jgi:hypothetical protein
VEQFGGANVSHYCGIAPEVDEVEELLTVTAIDHFAPPG